MENTGFSPAMAVRVLLLSRHRIRTLTHHLLHHLNPHISRVSQNPIYILLFLEMRDGGVEIRLDIFWVMFRSYCRAKLPLDAVRVFSKMGEFGLQARIDDLNYLLLVLCRNGLIGQAEEFFEEVKSEFEIGAKSYNILMKGWGDRRNGEDALRVFDKMLERGCAVDVFAYNTLLASLCHGRLRAID